MQRPDAEILGYMFRAKHVSREICNALSQEPLFMAPREWLHDLPERRAFCSAFMGERDSQYDDFVVDEHQALKKVAEPSFLPYESYSYLSCFSSEVGNADLTLLLHMGTTRFSVFIMCKHRQNVHPPIFEAFSIDKNISEVDGNSVATDVTLLANTPYAKGDENGRQDFMHALIRYGLVELCKYGEFVQESLQYPVEVRPKLAAVKGPSSKNLFKNPQGPRVIYMNQLPNYEERKPVMDPGSGKTPKPHQRRAHGKTLRHPRFKNHPLFGIENAIKIKPVWIGPRTGEYEGNIYTVKL